MEKNIKRAERRFNNAKQVRKQMKILKHYDLVNSCTVAGKFVKHKALGTRGCKCCTNPRRVYGYRTLKEEINDVVFKEAMNNLDN